MPIFLTRFAWNGHSVFIFGHEDRQGSYMLNALCLSVYFLYSSFN